MNKIHKIIWSKVRHCYVVVSEITKRDGKSVGGFFTGRKRNLTLALLTFLSLSSVISFPVYADTIGTYHTGDLDYDKNNHKKAEWDPNHPVTDEDYGSIGVRSGRARLSFLMGLISGETVAGKEGGLAEELKHRTAIGNKFRVFGFGATAYGYGTNAVGEGSLAVGHAATTNGNEGTAIGSYAKVLKGQGTVVGANSWANDQAVALGADVRAQGYASISIGSDDADPKAFTGSKFSDKLPEETIKKIYKDMIKDNPDWFKNKYMFDSTGNDRRVWSPNYAAGEAAIAIGARTVALGDASTSIGVLSMALAERSTALGVRSLVSKDAKGGMALGEESRVMSKDGLAVGNKTYSSGDGSLAYGYDAKALGANSIAIGHNVGANAMLNHEAQVTMANVLLYNGEGKIKPTGTSFDTTQDRISYLENVMNGYDKKNKQWVDDEGSVLRQWKDGNNGPFRTEYRKKQVQTGPKQWSDNAIAIGRRTYAIGNNSLVLGSLSLGAGNNSLNVGHLTYTKGENSSAIGMEAAAIEDNSMAIGVRSFANLENSIAIGVGSKTDYTKDDLDQDGWAPRNAITFPSSTQVGVISVGKIGSERRISNVASGYRDTDAVNVSQLRALEERFSSNLPEDSDLNPFSYLAVDKMHGDVTKVIPLQKKEMNYRKYVNYRIKQIELQVREKNKEKVDETFKNRIQNVITNLEKGDNKTGIDASGLKGKNVDTVLNELKVKYPGLDTSDTNDVINKLNEWKKEKLKDSLKKALTNEEQNFLDGTNYLNDGAKGKDAIAVGYKAQSLADNSVAIGKESRVEKGVQGGIALGASSSATRAGGQRAYDFGKNTVYANDGDAGKGIGGLRANKSTAGALSIGSDSITRQITNVAGGSEDTDAVNVAQLKQVNNKINGVDTKINSVDTKVNNVNNKVEGNIGFNIEGNSGGQPWVAAGTKDSQKGKISLKIRGGDNDSNINVDLGRSTNDGFDTIEAKINLKHNLGNLESATFTKTEKGVTTTSVINDKGLTIGSGNTAVALTKDGLNMGSHQIHGVAEGKADTDAVNVAQVNTAIQAKADELKKKEIKAAQDTATAANSTANTANTTATQAKSTAEQAKGVADKVTTDLATYKTEVTTALGKKANTDLDNLTQNGKTVVKNLAKEQIDSTVTETFVTDKVKKGSVKSTTLTVTGNGKVVGADLTLEIKDKAISKGKLSDELVKEIEGKATKDEVANKAEKTYVDNQLNTKVNTSDFDTYKGKVTTDLAGKADVDGGNITAPGQWAEKLGTGKVAENDTNLVTGGKVFAAVKDKADKSELTNKADTSLNNIAEAGKTVIKDLAKGAVKVADGTNTTVTTEDGKDGSKTYKVNVSDADIKKAVASDLGNKADKDAGNIGDTERTAWAGKLGTGKVEANDANLVTGGTVQAAIKDKANTSLDNLTEQGKTEVKNLAGEKITETLTNTFVTDKVTKGSIKSDTLDVTGEGKAIGSDLTINIKDGSITKAKLNNDLKTEIEGKATKDEVSKKAETTYVDNQLKTKVNTSDFTTYKGEVTTALGQKADAETVTQQLATKVNTSDFTTYKGQVTTDLAKKADVNGGNITAPGKWAEKLGTGAIAANDTNLVTGGKVYAALNPVKTQAETNKADIATLQKGFTLKDGNTPTAGSKTVTAESTVTVTGDKYVTATVNDKGLTLGLNEDTLNQQITTQITSNSTVTGKMSAWKLKANGVDGEGTVNNTDNTVIFDVAEANKGLTVTRDKNTIKYGINVDSLANNITSNVVTNINNGKTAITNISTGFTVSAGNNTPLAMDMTKDKKPNLQFVSKDGNTEVTAEKTDDGTKVTIGLSAAAQQGLANQDLNFGGTSGTGKVNLKSQKLSITGDADGIISTAAKEQGLSMTVDKEKLASAVNSSTTKITNVDLSNNSIVKGKMDSWQLAAKSTDDGAKIDNTNNKAVFDVEAADKGLTVSRDGNTIKYGIEGSKIDLTSNTAITNINNTLKADKATVVAGDYVTVTTTANKETGNTFTVKGPEITGEGSVSVSDIEEGGKKVGYKITGKNTTLAAGTNGLSVADGKLKLNVADTDNNAVTGEVDLKTLDLSGNTTINNLDTKIENITKTNGLLDNKADKDASNIDDEAKAKWAGKLGTGKVEANDANLVTGGKVFAALNPVKTQAETNKADIATLQKGFTLKDGNTPTAGSKTVTAESVVTVTGDDYIKTKVDTNGLNLSMDTTKLNSQISDQITNNTTVKGKMDSWKLKVTGDTKEQEIKDGNTVTFDAETAKGLTVSRDGNTIKYGINIDSLASNITNNVVKNINEGNTAITNISTGFTVSAGNNTPLAMDMTKDKKPNLQFVSKDGNTEVTAEKTDDGTKVTIGLSAAAQQGLANQDLNFGGTSGTGKVNLKSQKLSITGDADGIISTAAKEQGLSMTVDKEKLASAVNSSTTKITNVDLSNNSIVKGKMDSWQLAAKSTDDGAKIDNTNNKAVFDVEAADKGLTVSRDGNTIKYGIEGSKIDLTSNTAITNINNTLSSGFKVKAGNTEETVGLGNNKPETVEFKAVSENNSLTVGITKDDTTHTKTITYTLADDLTFGKAGENGKDGTLGVNGKDGSSVTINGKDGSIGLNGTNGQNGLSIRGEKGTEGKPGVDGKTTIKRIVITDPDGKNPHSVATLDDGLKFKGDIGDAAPIKLNNQVNIVGGETVAANLSDGNIGVDTTKEGNDAKLTVKLAKNLKNLESATFTKTEKGVTTTSVINDKGLTIGNNTDTKKNVSLTKDGLNMAEQEIKNVKESTTATNAATVGQINKAKEDLKTEIDKKVDTTTYTDGMATKADANGANVTNPDTWAEKLGTGTISDTDGKLVTGKTVQAALKPISDKADQNATNIATLQEGFIIQDEATPKAGTKVIKAKDTITFKGGANLTSKVGDDGSVTYGLNTALTNMNSITFAAPTAPAGGTSKALTINGTAGTITGLTNTTWNVNSITSGRAATEDQLKALSETVSGNASSSTDYQLVKAGTTETKDGTEAYKADEKGDITLLVQDKNHKKNIEKITISDVASKSSLDTLKEEMKKNIQVGGKGADGADGVDGTIGVNGKDGKLGIGINGKDGGSITIHGTHGADGQDGQNGLTIRGVDGKNGEKGEKGVDGKDVNRIVTVDPNGTKHQLATLDDGLKFAGNVGNFYSKLNETVEIVGGVTVGENEKAEDKLTDENIGVVATKEKDKNGKLDIKLAKNLKNLSSATFTKTVKKGDKEETTSTVINDSGTTVTDKDGNTNQTTAGGTVIQNKDGTEKVEIKKDGLTIGNNTDTTKNVSLTKDGLNNGGKQIKNIADGTDESDAVNKKQLDEIKTTLSTSITNKADYALAKGDGQDGAYKVTDGKITLKVKNKTKPDEAAEDVVIDDVASKSSLDTLKEEMKKNIQVGGKGADGTDGVDGTIGINGKDGKLGIGINGKDGGSITIHGTNGTNGQDGENGLTIRGVDGKNGEKGEKGVDGTTTINRIVTVDPNGTTHQVATLDDGLKFAGDSGDAIAKKLNETVTISGGVTDETKLSDNNVGVVAKDGKLNVKLAKNLTGLESATFTDKDGNTNQTTAGGTVIQTKDGKEKVEIKKDGITITDVEDGTSDNPKKKISLTKDGFNNGGNRITNIANGEKDSDAATVGQVNAAKQAAMDTLAAGFDVKAGTVTGTVSLKANEKPTVEFLSAGNGLSVDLTTDAATHTQKITYRLSDTPYSVKKQYREKPVNRVKMVRTGK
ncbi:ESPR-type extended signal peptide-containing protein [Dialister micraerophilus]|uniref:Hep/Hag repeat protein n=1 Tax=Dialister micraerophilus UPII 345-E TaxID=910314 RepID=E4L819_9FIRM|nr:ESPR-type extended signal peptide-containing protein [Dialister micraerophilus]EFR43117.1 Hep/Hag repeat protein [Dialister micraerophilus UPII 345-E]